MEVKRLTKPGRYGDGGGLWLQVCEAQEGAADGLAVIRKSWLLRFMLNGKAREMGFGPFDLVSLAEARDKAIAARKLLLVGTDPLEERRALKAARLAKAGAMTFCQTAARYIAAHKSGWKNAKHQAQWSSTLETYVYPAFGARLVGGVDTGDVMTVLEPIWSEKPETASRVRGRIEVILDYAKSRGWRVGENSARWKGPVANLLPKKTKVRAVQHHPALPWQEVGGFMASLRAQVGTAAVALVFTILTEARSGEVIGARWSEFDLEAKIWTIPAGRMKAGRERRVSLVVAALAVLTKALSLRQAEGDRYVFPGGKEGKPISNMAMLVLLQRMKRDDVTAHGFRFSFHDWVNEATSYAEEIAEAALAHTVGDKVEAAYRRGDLFEMR